MQKVASSRSFGLLLAAVFVIIAAIGYRRDDRWYLVWAACALALLLLSLTMPRLLAPLKRLWLKLGGLLNLIVAPVVLGLVYALVIVPIGALIRLFGKELLSLRPNPSAKSYWIKREVTAPPPESLRDQF